MELVKITNTGTTPVRFDGNVPVLVEPGATRIVQFEWACGQLGNPYTDDPKERAHEYMLVRTWWGFQDGFDTEDVWLNEKKPKITVTTIDDEPMHMLIDDPDRKLPLPGQVFTNSAESSDVALMRAALAEQSERTAKLEALLLQLTQPVNATVDLDPADATALSTVVAADAQKDANDAQDAGTSDTGAHELPKPVATPTNAADAPAGDKATKTRLR